jgi:mannan endo-1,4-beta-mannosidase
MDDYSDMKDGKPPIVAADKLKIVSDYALAQHKIAAFTETGLENIPQTDWFTNTLLKVLKAEQTQIAYVMVWSNRQTSYWTPYKGHPAEADFIHFKNDPYVIFDDKMSDFYRITLPDKVK